MGMRGERECMGGYGEGDDVPECEPEDLYPGCPVGDDEVARAGRPCLVSRRIATEMGRSEVARVEKTCPLTPVSVPRRLPGSSTTPRGRVLGARGAR